MQGRETLPLSCFSFLPLLLPSRPKKRGEKPPNRCRLSLPKPSRSVCMEHSLPRPDQRSELPTSHHASGLTIAIHEHGGTEPLAIELPADGYPINFKFRIIDALVSANPALIDPGIPAKIRLLSLQEPMPNASPAPCPNSSSSPAARVSRM